MPPVSSVRCPPDHHRGRTAMQNLLTSQFLPATVRGVCGGSPPGSCSSYCLPCALLLVSKRARIGRISVRLPYMDGVASPQADVSAQAVLPHVVVKEEHPTTRTSHSVFLPAFRPPDETVTFHCSANCFGNLLPPCGECGRVHSGGEAAWILAREHGWQRILLCIDGIGV